MYYAKNSWWFKTTAVKEKLLRENSKIDWHPHYLKDGRFGEWLKEVRDWVISRERYWGAPLPIWECDKCKEMKVVGSIDEIRNEIGGLNKIFLVRHGEAKNNVDDILSGWPETEIFRLTEKGREKVKKTADSLKEEKIKAIFCSPVTRTRETAEIIAEELGLELIIDERLQEMGFGELNGKTTSEFDALFPTKESRAEKAGFGVETGENIRKRLQKFLDEVNEKYKNENIVVVSHGDPIQIFYGFTQGKSLFESFRGWYPDIGSLKITYSKPIDLHRPYIDKIVLKCGKCGGVMRRVPEVMDVWFDSGSMPYAQAHYPFENKKDIDERKFFPADYICEGLDQTRGWFYTLLAVSSLLGFEAPYKNVISLGLVLDEKSQKMSKSRGNVVEPMQLVEKYGADAVRWYFYTVNQPWDEKLFSEKDVAHALRRFLMIFSNCAAYFKTYSSCNASRVSHCDLVLNKWVIARLNQTVKKVTELLDNYDIVSAARKIEEFVVEDISHWYIRGIRNFIKEPEKAEAKESITVLGYILMETSRLLAPFVPFTAEKTYKELGGQKESVHLEEWPTAKEIIKEEEKILEEMEKTKKIVSLAIEERQKAGFGVRQSLSSFSTTHTISDEFSEIARREINVKEIKTGQKENKLDTTLTPELKNEGIIRELIRNIQDLRKKAGLVPQQKIELAVETDIGGERLIEQFEAEIKRATNTTAVEFAKNNGEEINIRGLLFKIKIKK
jgi:isoleucyl-tRNA synthetase